MKISSRVEFDSSDYFLNGFDNKVAVNGSLIELRLA
jgi:hypothetical protein